MMTVMTQSLIGRKEIYMQSLCQRCMELADDTNKQAKVRYIYNYKAIEIISHNYVIYKFLKTLLLRFSVNIIHKTFILKISLKKFGLC